MAAISEPGQHIVDTLIRLGADMELEDEHGYTPLHRFACNSKSVMRWVYTSGWPKPVFSLQT
jgi:hypothetical protein